MGFFDLFPKKSKPAPARPAKKEPSREAPAPKTVSDKNVLNRRKDLRYRIEEISAGDLGLVTEMSREGAKIAKQEKVKCSNAPVSLSTAHKPLSAEVVWQNDAAIGLRLTDAFDTGSYIRQNPKRLVEEDPVPAGTLSYYEISRYKQHDFLTPLTNLMAELESHETKVDRLKLYILEISEVHRKWSEEKEKEREKEKKSTGTVQDTAPEAADATIFPDLKEDLLVRSAGSKGVSDINSSDIDCIIARLGLDAVKRISGEFIKRNRARVEVSLPGFRNYHLFTTLKTVFLKRLSPFFGYKNEWGEGSSLLSLEACGLKILMKNSVMDLHSYYTSPSRLYSEVSRTYERLLFGTDLIHVNKTYFEKVVGAFTAVLDGYVLGYLLLNPHYTLDKGMKITVTKNKLLYSFVMYLTALAALFIIERDRESGTILMARLKRTGMDERKSLDFINDCVMEANSVLHEMGIRESIKPVAPPSSVFRLESYLPGEAHFEYLLKTFRNFHLLKGRRMVVRYDDEAYAHFILNRLFGIDAFGLNSTIACVIPCGNITDEELYFEFFTNFDLVIFKGIDRLPRFHHKAFMRLWDHYEGKIIATLSASSLFDYEQKDLYQLMKNHIVDFPSFLSTPSLHRRMVDHAIQYVRPFLRDESLDPNRYTRYLDTPFSMNHIKAAELLLSIRRG
ncbi:MAG: hypothetical protein K8I29_11860 [Alphaproteobacteria bacterium]|uniref:Uncharacterized protein n=1 Tax=Candidatus Nitrobium versatile TaxID=2884831 RepID=A0A953M264_9BACT|nr:hypothetical protein [Candidatus Nitrobium versatile]